MSHLFFKGHNKKLSIDGKGEREGERDREQMSMDL